MDYLDQVSITRHPGWDDFDQWRRGNSYRLILFTTRGGVSYLDHAYRPDDVLLFGRESAGVPDRVHEAADTRLTIPIRPGLRSLNVAVACAMARDRHLVEVVHPGTAERPVGHRKPGRLDDMRRHPQAGGEPENRPGILGNVRLVERDPHGRKIPDFQANRRPQMARNQRP